MTSTALRVSLLSVLALTAAQAGGPASAKIRRGAHLVQLMGCNDCHTPLKMGPKGPEPDMSRMLSGHPEGLKMGEAPKVQAPWMYTGAVTNTAFAGPWGVTYSKNLTSDKETGLGAWTEAQFIEMARTGRHLGKGRPVMPPMPIQILKAATDQELKDMFAYLQTVPAVKNQVPEYQEPAH